MSVCTSDLDIWHPHVQVFTPQQLKVIKQQQKLLAQLQKKMEKEQERRRKQEEKRRQKEKEEQEKKMGKGKRKGRSKKQERVRYFSSPLEQVAGEDGIPVFVKKCATYVEEKGMIPLPSPVVPPHMPLTLFPLLLCPVPPPSPVVPPHMPLP